MRRIIQRSLLALLLAVLCQRASAAVSVGQVHPNIERGFAADRMYQFGDLDHVNLFNGNLTVTIPIGGGTPVSSHMALSLTLVYNSKIWDAWSFNDTSAPAGARPLKRPSARSNAGLGFTVSLGRLFDASRTGGDQDIVGAGIHYESPDGGDHTFYSSVHGEAGDAGFYTRDGSYIRMRNAATGNRLVETPDGVVREFESWTDSSDSAHIHDRWRLIKITDSFGRYLNITYGNAQWTITDQYGRQAFVHFKDVLAEDSLVPNDNPAYRTAVDYVSIPAWGGGVAKYAFKYTNRWVTTGYCGDYELTNKNGDTDYYRLPLLSQVTLPDGTEENGPFFRFTYQDGVALTESAEDRPAIPSDCRGGSSGSLASMTLPTRGVISWKYGGFLTPTTACEFDPLAMSAGVYERKFDDPYSSNDPVWSYTHLAEPQDVELWQCGHNQAIYGYSPAETAITTLIDPAGNKSEYFFATWPGEMALVATGPHGTTHREYGLPLSHEGTLGDKLLSTKAYEKTVAGTDALVRTTYVKYEYDTSGIGLDLNRSLVASRTVFNDDAPSDGNPSTPDERWVETSYEENDGVGHYRKVTTTGNFKGTGDDRVAITDYNKPDALVGAAILDTGTYVPGGTGFVRPSLASNWLLNLYTKVATTEGTQTAIQEFCFEPSTGFLKATRTYSGATRAASDLVATFENTAADADGDPGAVTAEKYYGGDLLSLTSSNTSTLCDAATTAPGPLGYDLRHTYSRGVRATSQYYSSNNPIGFKSLDQTIDPSTGLVSSSRDTAEVQTSFTYDSLRRLRTATTASDPAINFEPTEATATTGASWDIYQESSSTSGKAEAIFDFDGFGRPVTHRRNLPTPAGSTERWSRQTTKYDGLGRKIGVSEWEESEAPSHFTTTTFDAFGRPLLITRPDNTTTSMSYLGARQIQRTTQIHTFVSGDVDATMTEVYDIHGRLHEVHEPDDNTVTSYTYDVGGRLKGVAMNSATSGSQSRAFNYDNRGFLLSETHPELGSNGNGTASYSSFDARGHARAKTAGAANGVNDLRFTFDAAERLTAVSDSGGARSLKSFTFASDNAGGNLRKGKLLEATRYNHLTNGRVDVVETYKYEGNAGRLSKRETKVSNGSDELQSFTQTFGYDDLGEITAPGYPGCSSCSNVPTSSASFEYRNGSLSRIPDVADLDYHGNWMVKTVKHANQVTDTYRVAISNGMPRPESIAYTPCSPPPTPVITAETSFCAGPATHGASVSAVANVDYTWSISGGAIQGSFTGPSIIYTTTVPNGTVTLMVTATNSCGPVTANRAVTVVARPNATVSGGGVLPSSGGVQIQAVLTGTAPWSVTWSDGTTQTTSSSPLPRTVTQAGVYTVTSVSDANASACGNGTSSGSATVTPAAPPSFSAATQDSNSRVVRLQWTAVAGATGYRMDRAACANCGWSTIGPIPFTGTTYDFTAEATASPAAWLYRVVALGNGVQSQPSATDYAVTANVLFAEAIVANETLIRGSHVQELRRAIDALRAAAGLGPYTTPVYANGWPDYNAPTGFVYAAHVTAMRNALSEAVQVLKGAPLGYPGDAPAIGQPIYAYHLTQFRAGVQ